MQVSSASKSRDMGARKENAGATPCWVLALAEISRARVTNIPTASWDRVLFAATVVPLFRCTVPDLA